MRPIHSRVGKYAAQNERLGFKKKEQLNDIPESKKDEFFMPKPRILM